MRRGGVCGKEGCGVSEEGCGAGKEGCRVE